MVFLSETKLHVNKLERIKNICGMVNCIGVSAEGMSGGLAMLWGKDIKLSLKSFSKNHLDFDVENEVGEVIWKLTGIYGKPDSSKRDEF